MGYGAELPDGDANPDEAAVAVFDPDTELEDEDEDDEHAVESC